METHPNVISVPSAAVGTEKVGKFVFTIVGGKAKRVPVTAGFDDGSYTEIVEGLHGDEQVVVTGRESLTPNASVTATQWTPPVKK
jgi:multidrug efflux pump subunit AcrA (membrane-fusion protein)